MPSHIHGRVPGNTSTVWRASIDDFEYLVVRAGYAAAVNGGQHKFIVAMVITRIV
jgi:hypothetical protein